MLLRLGLGSPKALILSGMAAVLLGVSGWAMAVLLRTILDIGANQNVVALVAVGAGVAILLRAVFAVVRRRVQISASARVEDEARAEFLKHALRLEMDAYARHPSSDMAARVGRLDHLRPALEDRIFGLVFDVVVVVAAGLILAAKSPVLGFLAFLGALLPAIVVSCVRSSIKASFEASQRKTAAVEASVLDAFRGVADLRAFGGESWTEKSIHRLHSESQESRSFHHMRLAVIGNTTVLLSAAVSVLILFLGRSEVTAGRLTAGELIFSYTMAGTMLGPLENLAISWIFFDDAAIALNRAQEILRLPLSNSEPETSQSTLRGELRLENVSFGFRQDHPAIAGLDLHVPAGQRCAIVGESGAGKSTLLNIAGGMYRPWSGRVLLDGVDLRRWPRSTIIKGVGIVAQVPHIFDASVRENLTLGSIEASDQELIEALRKARVEEVINRLPGKLDHRISDECAGLSKGEVQRIALARALVRKPKILLLDEATSNLDIPTEQAIWSALTSGPDGTTMVFVTHRLSTSAMADMIVVVERGKVVEKGSFQELTKLGGRYAAMWDRQSGITNLVGMARCPESVSAQGEGASL